MDGGRYHSEAHGGAKTTGRGRTVPFRGAWGNVNDKRTTGLIKALNREKHSVFQHIFLVSLYNGKCLSNAPMYSALCKLWLF